MLRIVGGVLKGQVVSVRVPSSTRPTTGLVREAIFSVLERRGLVRDATFVDLFAGTGAMGFEAVSRGAARVIWVDVDRRLAQQVRQAATRLGVATKVRVVRSSVTRFLAREGAQLTPDVVVLDPPYGYDRFRTIGDQLPQCQLVVVEASAPVELGERWRSEQWRRYGDTHVGLFEPAS